MNKLYASFSAVAFTIATLVSAQQPCLVNFVTPAGQTSLTAGWSAGVLPANTQVNLNTTTTLGSNVASVTGCNAVLVGATVSGPNFPVGTTVVSVACPNVTFSQNATASGVSVPHTFILPPYAGPAPPAVTGVPANLNCSVCPATFSNTMCAGQYINYYMCVGNTYTVSMCGSATSWDSFLAVTTTAGTVLATGSGTSDDDGCGTVGGQATLVFVPTASATYRIRLW
ncbi:MAG TPA: hypothetical protein PK760_15760, partial [Flavobacteriales bacterium]|nr:hypothetical protein [Flavobacteriales bacterium]